MTDALTTEDIDQVVEGIQEFIIGDSGVEIVEIWQPYIDKLKANRSALAATTDVTTALRDILDVIEADQLIPESVSYMQQARAALAKAEGRS